MENDPRKIIRDIASPTDVIFATGGALAGLGASALAMGSDLGTSVSAGALIGVSASQAIRKLQLNTKLLKCVEELKRLINKEIDRDGINEITKSKFQKLILSVESAEDLFTSAVTSAVDFESEIKRLSARYSDIRSGRIDDKRKFDGGFSV